jgi:hypothetical protein
VEDNNLLYKRDCSASGYKQHRTKQHCRQSRNRSPLLSNSRHQRLQSQSRKEKQRTKPTIQVDYKGMPMGKVVDLLHKDLIAFAKEMDPTLGWSKQMEDARNRIMDHVYEE